GEHGLDQLVLGAGQLQALDVAALAGGAGAEQPGDVAHGYDGELGGLRGGHGLGDAGGVGADEVGAGHGGQAGRGELLGERVGERGHVHGGAVVLEAGQDVVGEAVAAQEAARLDGGGSDQRDRGGAPVGRRGVGRCGGGGAAEREQPVGIVEQDDRLLRHAPSESAALGGVEVDRLARGGGVELRIQQAQLHLLAQDPPHGGVQDVLGEFAVAHGVGQVREGGGLGQLDVHPGV